MRDGDKLPYWPAMMLRSGGTKLANLSEPRKKGGEPKPAALKVTAGG